MLALNSCEIHIRGSSNLGATLAAAVAAIGMLGPNGLMAQATVPAGTEAVPPGAGEIDEIVVTASKRTENLSKTALAVSVLSQDQMTQQGITSTKDLTKEVPNLSLAVNGEGDAVVVNLRGIQSSNIFPDGDPAVAVYVDGVNIPRTQGLNGDLYDLARVEVLPNMIHPMLADFGLRFVFIVLLLSGLSFLGLGVQPPNADWGSLVRENIGGLAEGALAVMMPAIAIATLTIGVNLLIDNLRRRGGRGQGAAQ